MRVSVPSVMMVPVAVRDGKLLVAMVNPFDSGALDSYRPMAKQELDVTIGSRP